MPDQFSPELKHEALEREIKELATEVKNYREKPENKGLSDQELIKKVVKNYSQTDDTAKPADDQNSGVLPDYAAGAPPAVKLEIESLVDLAFHKGIREATKQARGSSPFVLDSFHDLLTGKLQEELTKRGMLK